MMIELRRATDLPTLLKWREEVIRNVFGVEAGRELMEANKAYYARHVADGTHIAVISSVDGKDCGCGAVCISDELPSPDNPSGRCGYVMNIYVREPYRMHGVAHAIVSHLIEEALARRCGKIYLETTDAARGVYDSLGFKEMENMMKYKI